MTSHDACTSGIPEFSQQQRCIGWRWRLLFQHPPAVKCGLGYVFECREHSADEIHRQLWQVYGPTRLGGLHISCRSSAGKCLIIIHPIVRTSEWQRGGYEWHTGSNPRRQTSTTQDTNVSIPEVKMLKISSTLGVSVPRNLLIDFFL